MAMAKEMMLGGLSWGQAKAINGQVNSSVTAAGTTITDATDLNASINVVTTAAASSGGPVSPTSPSAHAARSARCGSTAASSGDRARRNMRKIPMLGSTIPHEIVADYSAAKVLLKPASPGTGVIAGGGVRAVVEAAGIKDILTKSMGSANILNVVRATYKGLTSLKDPAIEAQRRGKPVNSVMPFWSRNAN